MRVTILSLCLLLSASLSGSAQKGEKSPKAKPDTIYFNEDTSSYRMASDDELPTGDPLYVHAEDDVVIYLGGTNNQVLDLQTNHTNKPPVPPRQLYLDLTDTVECIGTPQEPCVPFSEPEYTDAQVKVNVYDDTIPGGWFGLAPHGGTTFARGVVFFPDPTEDVMWEIRFYGPEPFPAHTDCDDTSLLEVTRTDQNTWVVRAGANDEACVMNWDTKGRYSAVRRYKGRLRLPFEMTVECRSASCPLPQ